MRNWGWAIQYGIAILLALLLGAMLGSFSLFQQSSLGSLGVTASDIVHFLGYGSALLVFWLLGCRAAMELPEDRSWLAFLRQIVVPLATVVVVSAAYKLLLLLIGPFLNATATSIYNWLFVLGITGATLWLALAAYGGSPRLLEALTPLLGSMMQSAPTSGATACPQCGVAIVAGQKFCGECGQSLASKVCAWCNQPVDQGEKFCGTCGKAVSQQAA